ncbi:MAG: hypothetical protein LLG01_13825 [Planctomycetaceae bacterium]|nr:hypothetical protein [Planctomycetaceae bacterium]
MTYIPKPIDTSKVSLPASVQGLVERLARNVHDGWAQQHIKEGWVSGPTTDLANRVHAMLVPYEQLTNAEQEYDRISVEQTLKPLVALGYRILPPGHVTMASVATLDSDPVSKSDVAVTGNAERLFDLCHATTAELYHEADKAAVRQQRYHRCLAVMAAVCGTVAALFALMQLATPLRSSWQSALESVFAAAAVLSVVLGMLGSRKARWLLERHKAEQLISLRFRALAAMLDGSGHVVDDEGLRACIQEQVRRITEMNESDVRRWMARDHRKNQPPCPANWPVLAVRQLYLQHRLKPQMEYFAARARKGLHTERWSSRLAPAAFFASVAFVFSHFVYELMRGGHGDLFSILLVLMAAALPLIGSGFRTLRGAFEFGRNALRFEANNASLARLVAHLEATNDPAVAAEDMWACEQLLETEHRQWLHLMAESEWFG